MIAQDLEEGSCWFLCPWLGPIISILLATDPHIPSVLSLSGHSFLEYTQDQRAFDPETHIRDLTPSQVFTHDPACITQTHFHYIKTGRFLSVSHGLCNRAASSGL